MCNQLFEYFACGHSKPICLTPCPHALETGKRIPVNKDGTDLSRSGSTGSSISPCISRSNTDTLPSHHRSSPRSPLSYTSLISRGQPGPTLPSRSNPPAVVGPPPGYPSPTSTPPVPVTRWSIHNPSPPRAPSPPTPITIPALPSKAFTIEPNFCPYHFPRDLPQSNHPCIDCYFLPKWAHLADRYVKSYREGHPLNKPEEAESMSGIERMRGEFVEKREVKGRREEGREGLLNVFVHGEDGVGRVG